MKKVTLYSLIAAALFFVSIACPATSLAEVNINIGVNAPLPRLVIPVPPALVLIPGTYAYFAPDIDEDIIFYHDHWYRPYRGYWYRATSYSGPWISISAGRVPRALLDLPPGFRHVPPGHQRFNHDHVKKNWRTWERERHWDKPHNEHDQSYKPKEKEWQHKEEKWHDKDDRKRGKGKRDD